jgi:uncharacterized membrane protein SpoIIM required for sporulation
VGLSVSAITEAAFVERRQRDWSELEGLLGKSGPLPGRGLTKLAPEQIGRVSPLYRDLCGDLSRAQAARYSAPLVEYLQGLTAAAHTVLYGPFAHAKRSRARTALVATLGAFPRAVRAHKRAMLLAALLFFVPFGAGALAALYEPSFAFRVVPEAMLRPLTEAYAKGFDAGRGSDEDALMAGFYVNNNVGIALRCFALGVFCGLGSAFYLVQNGLSIGAVLGYVASQGAGVNIITFIVGHGSLELGAIVLAGGAGLSLGWSIVAPGDRTRLASLQAVARDVLVIVCGAAVMLLMAAAIEAFWSSSSVPSSVKLGAGATLFALVVAYLTLGGRASAPRSAGPGDAR